MTFFSVIIPTYNRADLLPRAINSVLQQAYEHFEIVVVDDGSKDDTRSVVESINDNRIKYFYQDNAGVCAARNTGAKLAQASYLLFLDSDDYLLPGCLSCFDAALKTNEYDVITAGSRMTRSGNAITYTFLPGGFIIKKDVLEAAGGYDEKLRFGENTELKWRLEAMNIQFHKLNDIVRIYDNANDGGGSRNLENKVAYFFHIAAKHANLFASKPKLAQQQYQVAGVDSFRLGRKKIARQLLWQGFAKYPINIKALARATMYSVRSLFSFI